MSGADSVSSGKKVKDRIQQLSELRRGLVHFTDAQYGTQDDPIFVMHLEVDGLVSIVYSIAIFDFHSQINFLGSCFEFTASW